MTNEQKEKQIDNLVDIMLDEVKGREDCDYRCVAEAIVDAGYGHIPTAIEEFVSFLKQRGFQYTCIDNLAKEYLSYD